MELVLKHCCHKETEYLKMTLMMSLTQQESGVETAHKASVNDNQPPSHQVEQVEADQQRDSASPDLETRSEMGLNTDNEEPHCERRAKVEEELQETEAGGGAVSDDEVKGVKRKREEEVGQSTEKKKVEIHSLVCFHIPYKWGSFIRGVNVFPAKSDDCFIINNSL